LDESDAIKGRLTLHYGGRDSLVPMIKVDEICAKFAENDNVDVHVYDGAEHGFSFEGRPSYHEVAATLSARRAQDVFASYK
jgi:carboxymethylenebutenolidase